MILNFIKMKIVFQHLQICLFLISFLHCINGFKILGIFPITAKSHFTFHNAIMKSLIEAGHEVTVVTSFPDQAALENYTSIIDTSEDEFFYVGQPFDFLATQNVFSNLDTIKETESLFCYKVMNLPQIQAIFRSNEKLYDVLFVELLLLYKCFLPIAEKMNIPVIGTLSVKQWQDADHAIGNINHPAYIPYEGIAHNWKLDNIYGRLFNVWNYMAVISYKYFVVGPFLKKFHQDHSRQLNSLWKYTEMGPSLNFYNNHPCFISRPLTPNAIEVGGIHVKPAKPLPQFIEKFIDDAIHGTILFSMGSLVKASTLPPKTLKAFREAFAEIPQRVIWKFEDRMANLSSNVMVLDWLPQRDILEHKNVIAFISHCGQGGVNEAVYTATPIVAFPIFNDQIINADILQKKEVAVSLDISNVSKKDILRALNAIVNNTKYYNNMKKFSRIFKDRPMAPQQSVVYWTEYIVRHDGAPHLKPDTSHLNWFQYLLLDVAIFVAVVLTIFAFLVYCIVKFLTKFYSIGLSKILSVPYFKNKIH